ncbi:MAG: type II and III secretion system protein family protein [Rhodospirillales bacterium]|nr:type II and III secretion system protein family protein [Rhodospirillales bacterium]
MRWQGISIVLLLVAGFGAVALAQSQEPPQATPAPQIKVVKGGLSSRPATKPAPVNPVSQLPPPLAAKMAVSDVMRLAVNKSRIVEMPEDVREVLVSSSDIVDVQVKTPRQAFLIAKSVGDTNIMFLDRFGNVVLKLELHVQIDIDSLRATLVQILPGENISAYAVGDNLFLSGTVRTDSAAASARAVARPFVAEDAKLINLLKVQAEQQVLLKVRVSEMQKSALKELGIQTSIGSYVIAGLGGSVTSPATGALSGTLTPYSSTITKLDNAGRGTSPIQFAVKALEKRGLIKSLAEPNLTAVSGETAKLLAGGEYPVPVADNNGQISVQFKPFGVGLAFTPVVLSNGRISLKLSSEVSSIDTNLTVAVSTNISVYGLKVRRAESTVELPSGGSLMIAGLLQNDVTNDIQGLPGAKDLPILGALFRSTNFQRSESELVVSVTAYVVRPGGDSQFALPTDGMEHASDIDQYLFGRLHHVYKGGKGPPPAMAIEGPFGYIME